MTRILNTNLVPRVPTRADAEPEVRTFDLHGRHVLLDVNSLCVVEAPKSVVDRFRPFYDAPGGLEVLPEAAARPVASPDVSGRLFCREKPQFSLSFNGVRRVVLNVTHSCNLACGYCFAKGHSPGNVMPRETARRALGLIEPSRPVDVAFFGGEPLLAWERIVEIMGDAARLAANGKRRMKFHITTNGLLLDEDKVRFLSERPCSILVSLDGPEDLHNAARPARDAACNSFAATMSALECAKGTTLGSRLMARATFDVGRPELFRRLEFFGDLEARGLIRGFSIEPAVLAEGCASREGGLNRDTLEREYHRAAKWFVERIRAGKPAGFFHFRKLIRRIARAEHTGSECGAGVGYVTVAPDGTLFACHRECGSRVGHVNTGFDEELRAPWCDNRVYTRAVCRRCWARYLCGGGCRQANMELTGKLDEPAAARCFVMKLLIKECIWILTQLTGAQIARIAR